MPINLSASTFGIFKHNYSMKHFHQLTPHSIAHVHLIIHYLRNILSFQRTNINVTLLAICCLFYPLFTKSRIHLEILINGHLLDIMCFQYLSKKLFSLYLLHSVSVCMFSEHMTICQNIQYLFLMLIYFYTIYIP